MTRHEMLDKLETSLTRLVDGMVTDKQPQIDFLLGLDCLDDIVTDFQRGQNINDRLIEFFRQYRSWLGAGALDSHQKGKAGNMLRVLADGLGEQGGPELLKLAQEADEWSRKLALSPVRLTLRAATEQASLSDRFHAMLRREAEELNMLLSRNDHLLTCLDDILSSAELKQDRMHHHLAASLIYFMKLEGYKVEPYIKRLRRIQETAKGRT